MFILQLLSSAAFYCCSLPNHRPIITVTNKCLNNFVLSSFRYKFIAFPFISKVEPGPNNCKRVLSLAGIEKYEIGKTKVMLAQ